MVVGVEFFNVFHSNPNSVSYLLRCYDSYAKNYRVKFMLLLRYVQTECS